MEDMVAQWLASSMPRSLHVFCVLRLISQCLFFIEEYCNFLYKKIGGNVHWNRIPSRKNSNTGSLEPLDLCRPHLILYCSACWRSNIIQYMCSRFMIHYQELYSVLFCSPPGVHSGESLTKAHASSSFVDPLS